MCLLGRQSDYCTIQMFESYDEASYGKCEMVLLHCRMSALRFSLITYAIADSLSMMQVFFTTEWRGLLSSTKYL